MGSEDQENTQDGEHENEHGRNALGGLLFLKGHAVIIVADAGGHGLGEDFLDRFSGLAVAVTRRGGPVDLGAGIFVVMHDEFGAGAMLDFCERGQGDGLPLIVAHVELQQIVGIGAVLVLGFDVNLPLAAEPVKIIHEVATHEGLERGVNIAERDAEL